MKRSFWFLMVAASIGLTAAQGSAFANPGMSMTPTPAAPSGGFRPQPYPIPPVVVRPRYVPPVYVAPPVVRVAPPVVVPSAPPVMASGAGFGSGNLSNGAWIGQNPTTRMFSIAFDSPGVSGMGILINAGYSNIVRGPTNWIDATAFLKSIGAPGW